MSLLTLSWQFDQGRFTTRHGIYRLYANTYSSCIKHSKEVMKRTGRRMEEISKREKSEKCARVFVEKIE